jgi:uracil phosphoribosyltransferase
VCPFPKEALLNNFSGLISVLFPHNLKIFLVPSFDESISFHYFFLNKTQNTGKIRMFTHTNKEICHLVQHPYLETLLTTLRDKKTKARLFRETISKMSFIIGLEAAKQLSFSNHEVETPFQSVVGKKITQNPCLVSILRAGNGMIDGLLNLVPDAPIGHIGMYRDKSNNNQAVEYYCRLPSNLEGRDILLLDPLLATGNTALASIEKLKTFNVGKIHFLNLLSSKKGLKKINEGHPDVVLYTASIEPEMNEFDYLIPGVGDAGDRLYDTF